MRFRLGAQTAAYVPSRLVVLAIIGCCLVHDPSSCSGNLPKASNQEIPPLKPPQGEIAPSAWEENGTAIVTAGLLTLAGLSIVVWLGLRPRPTPAIPPEAQARAQLESLVGKPQTGRLLSDVSRVTRGYLRDAFGLPTGEVTTTEFCAQLGAQERIGASLGSTAERFLKHCDELKFSPFTPPAAFDAAAESLKLVELGEQQLAENRRKILETAADARKAGS
jgi:hypothetical protein